MKNCKFSEQKTHFSVHKTCGQTEMLMINYFVSRKVLLFVRFPKCEIAIFLKGLGCIQIAQAFKSALMLVQKSTILIPCSVQIAKYFCNLNIVRISMVDFYTIVYALSKDCAM